MQVAVTGPESISASTDQARFSMQPPERLVISTTSPGDGCSSAAPLQYEWLAHSSRAGSPRPNDASQAADPRGVDPPARPPEPNGKASSCVRRSLNPPASSETVTWYKRGEPPVGTPTMLSLILCWPPSSQAVSAFSTSSFTHRYSDVSGSSTSRPMRCRFATRKGDAISSACTCSHRWSSRRTRRQQTELNPQPAARRVDLLEDVAPVDEATSTGGVWRSGRAIALRVFLRANLKLEIRSI